MDHKNPRREIRRRQAALMVNPGTAKEEAELSPDQGMPVCVWLSPKHLDVLSRIVKNGSSIAKVSRSAAIRYVIEQYSEKTS